MTDIKRKAAKRQALGREMRERAAIRSRKKQKRKKAGRG